MYEKYNDGSFEALTPVNLLWILIAKPLNKKRNIAAKTKIPIFMAVHQPKKVVIWLTSIVNRFSVNLVQHNNNQVDVSVIPIYLIAG